MSSLGCNLRNCIHFCKDRLFSFRDFFANLAGLGGGFYSRLGRFVNGVALLNPYRTGRCVRLGAPRCGSRARPFALGAAARLAEYYAAVIPAVSGRLGVCAGTAVSASDQRERLPQFRAEARTARPARTAHPPAGREPPAPPADALNQAPRFRRLSIAIPSLPLFWLLL